MPPTPVNGQPQRDPRDCPRCGAYWLEPIRTETHPFYPDCRQEHFRCDGCGLEFDAVASATPTNDDDAES